MSRGFKTFFITFLVGAVLFGFAASYLFDNVVDGFVTQLLGIGKTEESTGTDNSGGTSGDVSGDVSQGDVSGDVSQTPDVSYPDDFNGESFGTLILVRDAQDEIDTILLIRRSKEKKAAVMSVIPSDTRLYIDGKNTKLRDLLKTRKIEFFMDKIEAITGVGVDYYISVAYTDIGSIGDVIKGKFPTLSYTVPYDIVVQKQSETSTDVSADTSADVSDETSTEPQYIFNIRGGKNNISADLMKAVLSYRKDDVVENHEELAADFFKGIFVQLYTTSNAAAIKDIAESVLALADTNMTSNDVAANIDIITTYASFGTVFVSYPGEYKAIAGGDVYYNPAIDSAINAFKHYR